MWGQNAPYWTCGVPGTQDSSLDWEELWGGKFLICGVVLGRLLQIYSLSLLSAPPQLSSQASEQGLSSAPILPDTADQPTQLHRDHPLSFSKINIPPSCTFSFQ